MGVIFLKIINMSIAASWLVLVIIVLRLLFKRIPKAMLCVLWGFVAIRLVVPFAFESKLSLIPSTNIVSEDMLSSNDVEAKNDIFVFENSEYVSESVDNDIINTDDRVAKPSKVDKIQSVQKSEEIVTEGKTDVIVICTSIWIVGMIMMFVYALISYVRIHMKVVGAVNYKKNIWMCDNTASPFILGIFKPRIILPSDINDNDYKYVVAHEKAHLKRRDNLWKPIGFLLLIIHWFNPLIWIAYILLCNDIEMACDEKVIKDMKGFDKRAYTTTLLDYSISRRMISVCPLAFGESSVESRIKSVLSYKKPAFWVLIIATLMLIGVGVSFLTNPKEAHTDIEPELDSYISEVILEKNKLDYTKDFYVTESHKILDVKIYEDEIVVYLWEMVQYYDYVDGKLKNEGGSHIPVVITVENKEGAYSLQDYWLPRDGSYYATDIKEVFPNYIYDKAIDSQRYVEEQTKECDQKAKKHYTELFSTFDEKTGYYIYPDTTGLLGNDVVEKCKISNVVLKNMTSKQLSQAVIDYPCLMIHFTSSQYTGTDTLRATCGAYNELMSRIDGKQALLEQIRAFEKESCDFTRVKLLKRILLDENDFEYTGDEINYLKSMLAYNVNVVDVGYFESEEVLEEGSLNSGVYPMFMFKSKKEFDDFNVKHNDIGKGLEGNAYSTYIDNYNESFFDDKSLFLIYMYTGSYMINPEVTTIYINEEQFSVYLELNDPGMVDCGGGGHLVLIDIDKTYIDECTSFGAYLYPLDGE